jgi:hypothetical protein
VIVEELEEIHSPDVTSALAPEVRKADHYQGGSGSKPLEKKLASSLKSRF